MSIEPVNANPTAKLDPSYHWEFNGTLAKAASQGRLFALCLAMHQNALAHPIVLTPHAKSGDARYQDEIASLSHYRQPRLQATDKDWSNMATLASLISTDSTSARLFQSMNPSPLAQVNDASRIPDDVKNNCSLGTQKRLANIYRSNIEEDNTMLYDIISGEYNRPNSNPKRDKDTEFSDNTVKMAV
ncbi:VC2046/SO_2500 family protein [Alteromonas sp. A081]|uniref:VC2046/SO_2500 family protein n=1 Tax=Alteromonas sp. A081 TaxID=3410269 RepID=UPI003B980845